MENKSELFLDYVDQYMKEEISNDYVSLHNTFENPENYGIDRKKINISFGNINIEENELEDLEKNLEEFNRSSLNEDAQKIYDELSFYLVQSKELMKDDYQYLGTYFEADSGIHVDLTTLFSEWVLRDEQDVKDLIVLLQDVNRYINDILEYTIKQAENGYLMIDIDSVVDYCNGVVASGKESSILLSMKDKIDQLHLDKGNDYKKELEGIFLSSFITAYKNISTTLKQLETYENNEEGLSYLKNGKKYYEILLKSKIGSNKTVPKVKSLLNKYAEKSLNKMQTLYIKDHTILEEAEKTQTTFENYQEIMSFLKENYENDFPTVNKLEYEINDIDTKLASSGISAYYVVPALDTTKKNQIKVNTQNNTRLINDIQTYTTLAHEGIPGHMYMYQYLYENCDHLYLKLQSHLSFTEGYATYVELYSMKYLKNINQDIIDLYSYNDLYSSCIIALADIGIHYDGWDFSTFCQNMERYGMSSNESVLQKQYQQIQANPTTFLPYYVGVIEILDLKEKAQEELGSQFVDKEFHEALIQDGSRLFDIVEDNIDEYIKEHK